MKVFIDANLLIYLNTLKSPEPRKVYEDFYLDLLLNYKAYVDVLVLDELIYISKRRYKVPYEITLEFIDSIVLPYVEILSIGEREYEKAVEVLGAYHLKPSDALHLAAMVLNYVSNIASEDKEFDKIKEISRIWIQ